TGQAIQLELVAAAPTAEHAVVRAELQAEVAGHGQQYPACGRVPQACPAGPIEAHQPVAGVVERQAHSAHGVSRPGGHDLGGRLAAPDVDLAVVTADR